MEKLFGIVVVRNKSFRKDGFLRGLGLYPHSLTSFCMQI
jgi:hypothetical protein